MATFFTKAIPLAALRWVFFYHLSGFVFAVAEFNHETFWVFLPAGVRLVAVILFGWLGVVGLFIGSVMTNDDMMLSHVLLLSLVSAVAPNIALITGRWLLHLSQSLHSLRPIHLFVLTLLASGYNALLSVGLFQHLGETQHLFNLIPMFVGDMVGTFIIFYLALSLLWARRLLFNQ